MKLVLVFLALLCSLVSAYDDDDLVPLSFIEPKDGSIHYHSHPLRIHLHAANSLKVPVQVSITCPNKPIHSQVLRTEQVAVIVLPPGLRGDVCEVSVSQAAYPLQVPEPVFVAIIDEDWAMELLQEPSVEAEDDGPLEAEDGAQIEAEDDLPVNNSHSKVRFASEEEEASPQVSNELPQQQTQVIQKASPPSPYLQPRPPTHLNNPVHLQNLAQQVNQFGISPGLGQSVPTPQRGPQKQVQMQMNQQQQMNQQVPMQQQQQNRQMQQQLPNRQMQQQHTPIQQRPMQQQQMQQTPIQQRPVQQYYQPQHQHYQAPPQQQSNMPPIFQYHHQNQFNGYAPEIDQMTPINPWTDPAADPNTDYALDALIEDMDRKSRGGDRPQWAGISRNEFARLDDDSHSSSSSVMGVGGKFRIEAPIGYDLEEEYLQPRAEQFRKSRRSRRSAPQVRRSVSHALARKSERKSANLARKSINTLLDTLNQQPPIKAAHNPFGRRSKKSHLKPATVNSVVSVGKPSKSISKSVTTQKKREKKGKTGNNGRKSHRRR